nr:MAG TPA: hypothetical protein [Caudoviricetes sp.]
MDYRTRHEFLIFFFFCSDWLTLLTPKKERPIISPLSQIPATIKLSKVPVD